MLAQAPTTRSTLPAAPTVNYIATDPLGSPRVLTNKQGEVVSRRDFMPFGEEIVAMAETHRTAAHRYGVGDGVRQKFTGYERDEETGLDFAEARYYYNNHGRFTAVDPLLASGKSADPQTFNRYAYTMNRPMILTDPSGLQAGRQGEEPDVKIEENERAAKSGNSHIAIVSNDPFVYNNVLQAKSREGTVLKDRDEKDIHYGFGTEVKAKVNFAEGVNAKEIKVHEKVVGEIVHADGTKEPYSYEKTIESNANGDFYDQIGILSANPIPEGATATVIQTLSVSATYVSTDGSPSVTTTEEFRKNEIVIFTGDKDRKRTVSIKDITSYEDDTILPN